ncbi:MAG TPA: type IIL restriction-modification enzyme MmeI [Hyphomicrobiaceae bacterium]|nr:type IIL restriction-modification enzyme MmeI [Hyphomicrobiaceae bacterium]
MNAVEIEEAVSALMAEPFDKAEFPYQFLAAFGFKDTTIRKLRAGASATSDVPGAVLLRSNIHLAVAEPGKTSEAIKALKASPKTTKGKVKFVLATDGAMVEAEELASGDIRACPYAEVPKHFGFFLSAKANRLPYSGH